MKPFDRPNFYSLFCSRSCEIEMKTDEVKEKLYKVAEEDNEVAGDLGDIATSLGYLRKLGTDVKAAMQSL